MALRGVAFFGVLLIAKICSETDAPDLSKLRVKELRTMLAERGVECVGCAEKEHLVQRVRETMHLPKKAPTAAAAGASSAEGRGDTGQPSVADLLGGLNKKDFFQHLKNSPGAEGISAQQKEAVWNKLRGDLASGQINVKSKTEGSDKQNQSEAPPIGLLLAISFVVALLHRLYLRKKEKEAQLKVVDEADVVGAPSTETTAGEAATPEEVKSEAASDDPDTKKEQ